MAGNARAPTRATVSQRAATRVHNALTLTVPMDVQMRECAQVQGFATAQEVILAPGVSNFRAPMRAETGELVLHRTCVSVTTQLATLDPRAQISHAQPSVRMVHSVLPLTVATVQVVTMVTYVIC